MKKKNKIFIYCSVLILLIFILIGEIIFINYSLDNNPRFRTNFNLMFGYRAWGRDYAEEIINTEYNQQELAYTYTQANLKSDSNVIKPYLITFYFFDESSITYIAWIDSDTYLILWEVLEKC